MSTLIKVLVPDSLRRRLVKEAKTRTVEVSDMLRALAEERLSELDGHVELVAAETWQREQARAEWVGYQQSGEAMTWQEFEKRLERAVARGRRPSEGRSTKTSTTRSRGSSKPTTKTGSRGSTNRSVKRK